MMENKKRDLIDRRQIIYTWWELPNGKLSDGVTLQSVIESMSTVDALEVVRCKDCVYYKRVQGAIGGWCDCEITPFDMDPDDFCSRGELK